MRQHHCILAAICTTGVQQGDPMGPLLFAAKIHNVISKVAAEYPSAWCIWYLDDGTVVGDLNTLNALAARLNQELNGAGLTMNIGKCHVTSATSTELFPMLRMMRYHPISDSEGIRVLGIPVGGKQYIQDFLSSVVGNVGNFCDAISTLRCSQIGASLLRHCSGACKVVHVLNVSPQKILDASHSKSTVK